ncbi:hypothetical protein C2E23DRAFT_465689 [Lenzites betulinus]|nr:hypothetical protein C2E23DRAFT_465689 [Lenzites betulinus]
MLATNRQREGTTEEILAWVDSTMEKEIRTYHSKKAVMRVTKAALDCVVSVTGRKPRPGKDTVFIRPIPDSQYSIRLWAGSAYTHEFCMDFVDSVTEHAVNSPFKFELWIVPDPDSSWLGAPAGCVRSLERNFGISQDKILPGEEKFILRDGQTCLIKRPGKRDILFTVPVRKRPERTAVAHDAHVLDFPKEV